jgi:hypothetical protein
MGEQYFLRADQFDLPIPPYLVRGDKRRHRSRWHSGRRLAQTIGLNRRRSMKIKTNVKAGGDRQQHNQTVARGLKVKTNVKAGDSGEGTHVNHNLTVARGLKVKTHVMSGGHGVQHNQTVARGVKVKSGVKAGSIVSPRDPQ